MRSQLGTLLPADAMLEGDETHAWAVAGVFPKAVVFPDSTEQVAAVLRVAAEEGSAVEPAGGGSWLRAGRKPANPPIVLSAARFTSIAEYEPADLVATVGAGVKLTDFQEQAAKHRQRIALDPPGDVRTTIGGVVANASAGPLRFAFGAPRDQVLGLELVTGDGRVVNLGGKVVKNVAGYDLTRLVVGSHGTLGVITRVHMRLQPRPVRSEIFTLDGEAAALGLLALSLRSAALEPAALELKVGEDPQDSRLYVWIQGNEATIASSRIELARVAGREPAQLDEDGSAALMRELTFAKPAAVSIRIAALPTESLELMASALRVRACLARDDIWLHAGSGIVRIEGDLDADMEEFLIETIDKVRTYMAPKRATVRVVAAPPHLHDRLTLFQPPGPELRLMRELKRRFDPAGIMAPARFAI
jgi:glycolate oxidase FAD binding subunit